MLRRDSRCDSACGWLRMARPSRSRSRSGDSGAKCSSGVAFAKATILTRIALDARFPNKSESAFGVEAGFESSSESLRIAYCDRPYCLPQPPESSNTSRSRRIIARRICECVPARPFATSADYQAPRLTLLADVLLSDHRVTSNRCPYTQRMSPPCLTSTRLRRNARHRHTLDIQNVGTPDSSRLRYR